jgi:hypothetical protein
VVPVSERIAEVISLIDVHDHDAGMPLKLELLQNLNILIGADTAHAQVVGAPTRIGLKQRRPSLLRRDVAICEGVAQNYDRHLLGCASVPVGVAEASLVIDYGSYRITISTRSRELGTRSIAPQQGSAVVPQNLQEIVSIGQIESLGDAKPEILLKVLQEGERYGSRIHSKENFESYHDNPDTGEGLDNGEE